MAAQVPAPAQTPQPALTAEAIMARVAANQDSAEKARTSYVYVQHARVISRRGDKVMCEELTDARVTPTLSGSHQQMLSLTGRLLVKGKYVHYTHLPKANMHKDTREQADGGAKQGEAPGPATAQDHGASPAATENEPEAKGAPLVEKDENGDLNISIGDGTTDRDLVENMREHMVNDTSKDGIGAGLFPLTSKIQSEYEFHLLGRQQINGRDVFHLEFEPKDGTDYAWKGEAYIDAATFQPVMVRTNLSRKIPLAVRMLLGTNVPGLGFSVTYSRQQDGVWFPSSFGTEFKIHVLFFFRREIVISAENRDFEKTHVKSRILGNVTVETTPPAVQQAPQ